MGHSSSKSSDSESSKSSKSSSSSDSESCTEQSNDDCPFITSFYNFTKYSLKITKGEGIPGQSLSPPVDTVINAGDSYDYCLFDYIIIDIFSDSGATGDYLGTASVSVKGTGDGRYLLDSNNLLVFSYDAARSKYNHSCWQWRRAEDISAPSIDEGPPVITNKGWNNGMNNQDEKATGEESFFVQDYGMNEQGRWNICNGFLCQNTEKIGTNYGSRAYPVYLSTGEPTWKIENCTPGSGTCTNKVAPGTAFEGCWQIDMKCGSTGTGNFCETFYLAERANLNPGPKNYQDGSNNPSGGNSREIDIMETKWKPDGPQANCPNGGNTAWNTGWSNQLMGKWDDVGGLPMKEAVTFGCLIRDNNLWIYGYKPDGSQWFCSDSISMNNTEYIQKNPFVPYIGTWTNRGEPGDFSTCYNNFVYLSADDEKIVGKNPKDNSDYFGKNIK